MPVYSFQCTVEDCATQFDVAQKIDDLFPACPECGNGTRRLISGVPAFSLKGSNWSRDGYASTDRAEQANSEKREKKDRITSFAGQKHKGRTDA